MRWLPACRALIACLALAASPVSAEPLGLFTSLPILWPEQDDLASLLKPDAPRHWLSAELERRGGLVALDRFSMADASLRRLRVIVMAQPRPLAPAESAALDRWVRKGGRLLLFADPMLTGHSAFPIGDKRRPQDVVRLGPLLAHWGLVLDVDEDQAVGEHTASTSGVNLPVNLPGAFEPVKGSGRCRIVPGGLLAECRPGKGRVLAIADAALLETASDEAGSRRAAFSALLDRIEPAVRIGENRGEIGRGLLPEKISSKNSVMRIPFRKESTG